MEAVDDVVVTNIDDCGQIDVVDGIETSEQSGAPDASRQGCDLQVSLLMTAPIPHDRPRIRRLDRGQRVKGCHRRPRRSTMADCMTEATAADTSAIPDPAPDFDTPARSGEVSVAVVVTRVKNVDPGPTVV